MERHLPPSRKYLEISATAVAVLICIVTFSLPSAGDDSSEPVQGNDQYIKTEKSCKLLENSNPAQKVLVLTADIDNFPALLDRVLSSKGNLGDSSDRLYWRSGTTVTGDGDKLTLRSRIRFENWVDLPGLSWIRVDRDSSSFSWALSASPVSSDSDFHLDGTVESLPSLPTRSKAYFKSRFPERFTIPISKDFDSCTCSKLLTGSSLTLQDTIVRHVSGNVHLEATYEIEENPEDTE